MINEVIAEVVSNALQKKGYSSEDVIIIKSNRPDLCDYQYDGTFRLAKTLKKNPFDIGTELVATIDYPELFTKVECIRPGFINFTISPELINKFIRISATEPKFGMNFSNPKTYVIDYGGPNIAKPLHVGHLRSAIVGESIKRIIAYCGNTVISDVHLGDYGLQIGQVIYGLLNENIAPASIEIDILERIYPSISALCKTDPEVKEECAAITKALQDGDATYQEYWQKICQVSSEDIKRLYKYLDVSFDYWYGESDAYPYIEELTKFLNAKNLLQKSEGALIIDANLESDDDLPPLLYQKSNNAYLYGTTDLGTIYQRLQDHNPDYILYLTDARQELHFKQVFNVCQKSNLTPNTKLEHLSFGTVNGLDGKPYKTRNGEAPKLDTLFNDVKTAFVATKDSNEFLSEEDKNIIVNAIIKFADLQNNREKDYIFDIAKFSEVIGKTGPYILYTYLRINKILLNTGIEPKQLSNTIYNETDRNLRLHLLELPNSLQNAYNFRAPSYISNYLYELCVLLNAFYQTNHINNLEDMNKKEDWLYLLKLSNNIIKDMLELLVIQIPSEM